MQPQSTTHATSLFSGSRRIDTIGSSSPGGVSSLVIRPLPLSRMATVWQHHLNGTRAGPLRRPRAKAHRLGPIAVHHCLALPPDGRSSRVRLSNVPSITEGLDGSDDRG